MFLKGDIISTEPDGKRYFGYFLIASTLVFIFLLNLQKVHDYDVWYHLKTGEYIVNNRAIPVTDVFSHTAYGRPWMTHEWLSDVIFYLVYSAGGIPGLVVFKAAMLAAVFGVFFIYSRGAGVSVHVMAPVAAFAAILVNWRCFERPELFTNLFAAGYLSILETFRKRRDEVSGRYLWALPVIMIPWANAHSGAVFGLIIIGAYAFEEAVRTLFVSFRSAENKQAAQGNGNGRLRLIILISAATLLAGLLNPNTYRVYTLPYVSLELNKQIGQYISEYYRAFWPAHALFFIFFSISASLFLLNIKKASLSHAALFILFSFSAFRYNRNIVIWAIVATPVVAECVTALKENLSRRNLIPRFFSNEGALTALNASLIVLLAFLLIGGSVKKGLWGIGVMDKRFPEGAIRFIEGAGIGGNMYNSYELGGYVIWRTYPQRRVYVDGRSEIYTEVLSDQMTIGWQGFENLVKKYNINYAIFNYGSFSFKQKNDEYINFDPYFREKMALVYWDDVAMVYVNRSPENSAVIEMYEYKAVRPTDPGLKLAEPGSFDRIVSELNRNIKENPSGSRNHLILGNLYWMIGNREKAIEEYDIARKNNPLMSLAPL